MKRGTKVLALVLAFAVAGCSNGDQSPLLAGARGVIANIGKPKTPPPTAAQLKAVLTPDQLAQIGTPVIVVDIPARGAALLATQIGQNGTSRTYLTPSKISFVIDRGMVVATRGLGFDLMSADIEEPRAALERGGDARRIHRHLDGENQLQLRGYVCRYAGAGTAEVKETCYTDEFFIENSYVLRGGTVRASRQWLGPEIGYVAIEHFD
jgi:hypothetical protein